MAIKVTGVTVIDDNRDADLQNVTADSVQLNGGTGDQGTLTWNVDEETLDLVQNGATLQLGQEVQVHCRNNSGVVIPNGAVVMATGTLGSSGRITIATYDNTTDVKYVIGVATEVIDNDSDGKVTSFGKVRGLDTSAYTEGTVLYTAASGGLTATEPTSGVKKPIAFVITSHATNGVLMVRVNAVDEMKVEHGETAYGWGDHSLVGYYSSGSDVSLGNITTTGYLRGPATFTIDPAAHGDDTGTVVIAGNLQVDGTTTTINSTSVTIDGVLLKDGTVDGRDVSADGSKLDGIEAGATADQSASEILTAIKTVDGAGSGLDADTLDGIQASSFLQGNQTITLTGDVSGSGTTSIAVTVADDSHNHVISNVDGLQTALDGKSATSHNHTLDGLSNTTITSNTSGEILKWDGSAWINNTLAEAGIQPAGSYLTGNQTITLSGDVSGSGTTSIAVTVADDSHSHSTSTITGLGTLATLSSVNAATITDNSVGAAELNVSGNGTSGQALTSDGDGTFSWTTISGGATSLNGLSDASTSDSPYSLAVGPSASTAQSFGTAIGYNANSLSYYGTAIGYGAKAGMQEVAVGYNALLASSSTSSSTAVGHNALTSATSATSNVAIGKEALESTTTGGNNVVVGTIAGASNTTGYYNTFVGYGTGRNSTTGKFNVYVGHSAGYYTTSDDNTFIGLDSGKDITTGARNTILGQFNGNSNGLDIRTSDNNIILSDGSGIPRLYHDSARWRARTAAIGNTWSGFSGSSQAFDFQNYNNFIVTLNYNFTMSNPSTEAAGQTGFFVFKQDATGGKTVSLGSDFLTAGGAGLTLSSAANAIDVVPYVVAASGQILLGTPQLAFA
jgi:hypothetical protein